MKPWVQKLDKTPFRKGLFSQSYQDELIKTIFQNVSTVNPTPFCCEFGFNSTSLTDGSGANTSRLIIEEGWNSLLLDSHNSNPEINLYKYFLTPDSICDVFRKHGVPKEPEYISIDVDSTDLWLFDALLSDYQPLLVSVEYNSHFPISEAITAPNNRDFTYEGDRGYGASLRALNLVASKYNYSLLWVVSPLDAFFIRNDLIEDESNSITFPFSKWEVCTNVVHHSPLKDKQKHKEFLDYKVFLDSGGNLDLSCKKAREASLTALTDTNWINFLRNVKWAFYKIRRALNPAEKD